MIRPGDLRCGITALVMRIVARTLRSYIWEKSSGVASLALRTNSQPALFTRISISGPNVSRHLVAIFSGAEVSRRSICKFPARAELFRFWIWFTRSSMPAWLLSDVNVAQTWAPRLPNSIAHCQPIPREAPVTMATLPARLCWGNEEDIRSNQQLQDKQSWELSMSMIWWRYYKAFALLQA